jgi:hypothetical protein
LKILLLEHPVDQMAAAFIGIGSPLDEKSEDEGMELAIVPH